MELARSFGLAGASMQLRHALIVDKDEGFAGFLGRCLRVVGFDSTIVGNRRQALEFVASRPMAIAFVAVERPRKSGFSLFSDLRRVAKRVPIVLCTSTVPKAEMMLHQKLRLHADAYLDNRELSASDVLETLDRLLDLRLDDSELQALARNVSRAGGTPGSAEDRDGVGTARTPDVEPPADRDETNDAKDGPESVAAALPRRGTDPELAALLGGLGIDGLDDEIGTEFLEDDDDHGPAFAHDDPESESAEDLAGLRRELDAARRAARNSPFSTEYLELADKAERSDRETLRLRRELKVRARAGERTRRKLIEIAGKLLDAERARDRATENIERLEAEVARLNEKLRQADDRARQLKERLADQQAQSARAMEAHERRLTDEMEARRAESLRELETVRREHEAELCRQADALQVKSAEWQQRLESAEREHANLVESMRQQHQAELDQVRQKARNALEEQARKHQADTEAARESQIEEIEALHRRALEELRSRHGEELDQLRGGQDVTVETLTRELTAERARALEARDADWAAKLEELRGEHRLTLQTLREDHRNEIERLTTMHRETLEEKEQAHAAALRQAVEGLRQQHENEAGQRQSELESMKSEQGSKLGEIEQRYRSDIQALKHLHASEIELLTTQHSRERELLQGERATALEELNSKLHADHREALEAREREWQARLDDLRREKDRAIEREPEEMHNVIDKLEESGRVDRPNEDEDQRAASSEEDDAGRADARTASVRQQLRELVAQFKRFDSRAAPPDDDSA